MTNLFDSTRFLGYVNEVSPKGIRIHVPSARLLSRFRHEGIQFPGGNVGEFALAEGDRFGFLVRILSLKLPDSERKALSEKAVCEDDTTFHPVADAEILFSFAGTHPDKVERTISRFPEIGAKVYSCPALVLNDLLNHATDVLDNSPVTALGSLTVNGLECPVPLDSVFGRHCAIVGTTGSGKSWTVARLLQALISKTANKVVLLDPTGEYSSLDQNKAVLSFQVGVNCHFPYESLHVSDLFYLLRPTAQSQRPVLLEAIRSLKTVRIALSKKDPLICGQIENECLKKVGFSKRHVRNFQYTYEKELDEDNCAFNFKRLSAQIRYECVKSPNNPNEWEVFDPKMYDFQTAMVFRIRSLLATKSYNDVLRLSGNSDGKSSSIPDIINSFLEDSQRSVVRLDFSAVSSSFNIRELVANAIANYLYEKAKDEVFMEKPIIVFVDEAHLFLNKRLIDADQSILPLDAFDLIAKECRKYGLFLCLSTQMPRDIPVGTLSQMGSFIVHRLINDQDRKVVEAACSSASYSSLAYLPTLGPGEALVTGVDFPMPLLLKIDRPRIPPKSDTPKLLGKSMPE